VSAARPSPRKPRRTDPALPSAAPSFLPLLQRSARFVFYRYRLTPTRRVEYVSPSVTEMVGHTPAEHYADPDLATKLILPEDEPLLRRVIEAPHTVSLPVVLRWRAKNGRVLWTKHWFFAELDRNGDPTAIEGLAEEVSASEQADGAASLGAERLFALSLDMLCIAGVDGYFKRLNPAWERTLGWTQEELLSRPYLDFVHPEDRERTIAEASRIAQGSDTISFENRYRCKDGTYRWILWKSTVVPERGLVYAVARDITGRKLREQTVVDSARHSERLYRDVFDHSPIGICQTTPDGRFLTANAALIQMLGYGSEEDLCAHSVSDLYAGPGDREPVVRALEGTGRLTGVEVEWRRKDGARIWVQLDATVVRDSGGGTSHYQAFVRDVTQRRTLEEQFFQAQKMEAVGRLAGGVAHDFNNLLTAIMGNADLMLEQLEEGSPLAADLLDIKQAGERAAGLTRQLLALSRKQIMQPTVLDLNEVVAELDKMFRRLIGEDIDLLTAPSPHAGLVKVDRGQIEQVLLNLVINARDAMPKGGKITIATQMAELGEDYAAEHAEVKPGRFVVLSVSDTGHGMDAATQGRIFEPFFTTKEKGKGTGLGLSTVYGIVKQSEGHLWVYSEPGRGATFKVYLPVVEAAPGVPPEPRAAAGTTGGSETILVVEDEDGIRRLARRALERTGFTVLEARNATEALEMCESHPDKIHLALTDVVMPGIGGGELGERLRPKRPDCRVLYMSGYTDDAIMHHGVLEPGTPFLEKPFTPESLVRKVREVLDA